MKATTKTQTQKLPDKNCRSLWTAPGVITRAGRHDSIVADLYVWKVRCDITCNTGTMLSLQYSLYRASSIQFIFQLNPAVIGFMDLVAKLNLFMSTLAFPPR